MTTTAVDATKMPEVCLPPSKSKKSKSGLVKSGWSFRRKGSSRSPSKIKKQRKSSRAASIVMDKEDSKTFLIEDSASSISTPVASHAPEDSKSAADSNPKDFGLDLVVLLMHPLSHRFELLQLEFEDASRARVSDLLAQIPLSVTEACLKNQLYDKILDQNSGDKKSSLVLKSSLLVEVFEKSKPTIPKLSRWSHKMVLVARPQGLSDIDTLRMAKPIFTNRDIAKMLELSGFDVSPWKKKKFAMKPSKSLDYAMSKNTKGKNSDAHVKNSSTSYMLLGLVFAFIIGQLLQSVMVKPTPPGFILKPGSYVSKCGLFGYMPIKSSEFSSCQDQFLSVGNDGTATVYDENKKAILILTGDVCSSDKTDCVNGLVMKAGGNTLEMGGKTIKQALVRKSHKDLALSPWPFQEKPNKLKYKIGSAMSFSASK